MYYPIIDKLKELMADITSVKDKEPLIIEGTVTSTTGGTWTGNYSDIISAFSNNKPVLFKINVPKDRILVPVFECTNNFASSVCFPFNVNGTMKVVVGYITTDNNFNLSVIG